LSKVVGGLEFAIDRQNTDSMVEEKTPVTVPASKPIEEKATDDTEKKPLHQLQSVSAIACVLQGLSLKCFFLVGVHFKS